MKPKESAACYQTLSARVGSGDETRYGLLIYDVITISDYTPYNFTGAWSSERVFQHRNDSNRLVKACGLLSGKNCHAKANSGIPSQLRWWQANRSWIAKIIPQFVRWSLVNWLLSHWIRGLTTMCSAFSTRRQQEIFVEEKICVNWCLIAKISWLYSIKNKFIQVKWDVWLFCKVISASGPSQLRLRVSKEEGLVAAEHVLKQGHSYSRLNSTCELVPYRDW